MMVSCKGLYLVALFLAWGNPSRSLALLDAFCMAPSIVEYKLARLCPILSPVCTLCIILQDLHALLVLFCTSRIFPSTVAIVDQRWGTEQIFLLRSDPIRKTSWSAPNRGSVTIAPLRSAPQHVLIRSAPIREPLRKITLTWQQTTL
jgi:hypothetical protein